VWSGLIWLRTEIGDGFVCNLLSPLKGYLSNYQLPNTNAVQCSYLVGLLVSVIYNVLMLQKDMYI
jgi:hypothetical protein